MEAGEAVRDGVLGVGDCNGVSKLNSGFEVVVGGMAGAAGVLSKAEKSQTSTGAAVDGL